jgi:hypothetical protein
MEKTIIIDDTEYICSDREATLTDDEVIFEIVDSKGRNTYVIAGPTDLLGDSIKNIWFIESANVLSTSIFPDDMFYDDEYYKSTYFPTIEEEAELSKLSSEKNEYDN